MLTEAQFQRIVASFSVLKQADQKVLAAFQTSAFFVRMAAGQNVFVLGQQVDAIALLLSGQVRVYKISETGREITLYRFSSGESCILTANAILNSESFSAIAIVEDDAEAVMVPADIFREWVDQHPTWREFVFTLLSTRLLSMMEIVEEVAFGRMDNRVRTLLLNRSRDENPVKMTHQEIAAELGSSREVITRILSTFAAQGLIEMRRGEIIVRLNAPS